MTAGEGAVGGKCSTFWKAAGKIVAKKNKNLRREFERSECVQAHAPTAARLCEKATVSRRKERKKPQQSTNLFYFCVHEKIIYAVLFIGSFCIFLCEWK